MVPHLSPDPFSDLDQLTRYPFMVHALLAGTLVAVLGSIVGWFTVLRRESFAAHTLSVMAFPGAAGGLLIGISTAAGGYVACALAALAILAGGGGDSARRAWASAVTGTVQVVGLAAGFLFLSLYGGVLGGYEGLLFGDFLGITSAQVLALAVLAALLAGFYLGVGRPLLFASVDTPAARARQVPVRALAAAHLVVLGLAVAATAQITGALLVFALLVAPAATAQQITARTARGLGLTLVFALLTAWFGLGLAYFLNVPIGFPVTSIALGIYLLLRTAVVARDALATRAGLA